MYNPRYPFAGGELIGRPHCGQDAAKREMARPQPGQGDKLAFSRGEFFRSMTTMITTATARPPIIENPMAARISNSSGLRPIIASNSWALLRSNRSQGPTTLRATRRLPRNHPATIGARQQVGIRPRCIPPHQNHDDDHGDYWAAEHHQRNDADDQQFERTNAEYCQRSEHEGMRSA